MKSKKINAGRAVLVRDISYHVWEDHFKDKMSFSKFNKYFPVIIKEFFNLTIDELFNNNEYEAISWGNLGKMVKEENINKRLTSHKILIKNECKIK